MVPFFFSLFNIFPKLTRTAVVSWELGRCRGSTCASKSSCIRCSPCCDSDTRCLGGVSESVGVFTGVKVSAAYAKGSKLGAAGKLIQGVMWSVCKGRRQQPR